MGRTGEVVCRLPVGGRRARGGRQPHGSEVAVDLGEPGVCPLLEDLARSRSLLASGDLASCERGRRPRTERGESDVVPMLPMGDL